LKQLKRDIKSEEDVKVKDELKSNAPSHLNSCSRNCMPPRSFHGAGCHDMRDCQNESNVNHEVIKGQGKQEMVKREIIHAGKGGGKGKSTGKGGESEPKEEPNFETSGLLAMEDNAKNGVPLKFVQPPNARRPAERWRMYVFTMGNETPEIAHIHRLVGYLFGKDRRVADVPIDHPTCSKQHAVLHHRLCRDGKVKPYIMDLESTNGTFLNGQRLESSRYYELKEKDILKFGMSTREYVLLHSGSADSLPINPKDMVIESG